MNAFKDTYDLFVCSVPYDIPMTYEEFVSCKPEYHAAILYIQFYKEITLAWYKAKSFYADAEEGVSTVMQYLLKNTPKIIQDSNRFKPTYIYRVAYNCLYCISHDRSNDKFRYELEQSNIVDSEVTGEECDIFNILCTKSSDPTLDAYINRAVARIICECDKDTKILIDRILTRNRVPKCLKAAERKCLAQLKAKLATITN